MVISKTGLASAAAVLGLSLLIGQASAMPASRIERCAQPRHQRPPECQLGVRCISLLVCTRLLHLLWLLRPELLLRAWPLHLCDARRLLVVGAPTPARTRRPGFQGGGRRES